MEDFSSKEEKFEQWRYKVHSGPGVMRFRYDYNTKAIWVLRSGGVWKYWDIHQAHTTVDGHPFIPYSAEAAFVAAYNMRFFGRTTGYGGIE